MPEEVINNKINDDWNPIHKEMSKDGLKVSFRNNLLCTLAKDKFTATLYDNFTAMAIAVRDRLVERWIITQQKYHRENSKRVYYLSMEFLIGRLMANNILNLGLMEDAKEALKELGLDVEDAFEQEHEAGLGNGGLGRLAACFLDSMATLGIPAHGYGIRYDYGIFRQRIVNGYQVESPDEWLKLGNPWEFARPEYAVKVRFGGRTIMFYDKKAKLHVKWVDTQDVLAMPYDIPVAGYKNDLVNTLRLWSARSTEEFDLDYFNSGDYEGAVYNKMFSESISKVLYPNDDVSRGKELRLKQEYFFTAASIADIIRRFKVENTNLRYLPCKAVIQLNDTHPSLAIVELMRVLIDQEDFDWETAWDITTKTFAYTNHTVMPEALELWPAPLFEKLLPRHLQIIYEINSRFLRHAANRFPGDNERLRRISIIEESEPKKIRMANLSIIGSFAVNGVSELHSQLLKTCLFRDFYELWPEKFHNKTNGVTPRRWLKIANPKLSGLITSVIGDKWVVDFHELEKLLPLKDDYNFIQKWQKIKLENKKQLAGYIHRTMGISINPEYLFDIQVKRIHEYKRQMLFCFYIISQYLKIKKTPHIFSLPRVFILGGKAAPGYLMAKLIIKFINSVAEVVNNDTSINDKLKVIFMENYSVSLAEKIFPAGELSEQISTAGLEASGTGCMKFMINGALTIGTYDGANIEISSAVGEDNIFIFGLKANEVGQLKIHGYSPREYINHSPLLGEIFHLIESNFFSPDETGLFNPLIQNLIEKDYFCICADFDNYCNMQEKVSQLYQNQTEWTKKSIINVAKSENFSSDRTIEEYSKQIWDIPYNKV